MAGGAAVSVTVFVTVSGAGASLLPQAVSTPMARIAPMPAVATRRRAIRPDLMMRPICIVNLNYIVQEIPRQCVDRRTRHALSGVGSCRAIDDTVQLFGAVKRLAGLAGSTIVLASVFPARDTSMASRCSPSSSTKVSWRWCGRQLSGCRRRRPWGTGGAGATRVAASLSATRKRRPSTKRSSANRRARVTERRRKHRPHSTRAAASSRAPAAVSSVASAS